MTHTPLHSIAATTIATTSFCRECEARIAQLSEQVSDLTQENANLRMLDEVMRRNTQLFEALLAHSSAGITLTAPDRRIVRVVHGLLGFKTGELTGSLVESLFLPEDRDIILSVYQRLLRRLCQTESFELRARRCNGAIAWFSITITDMLDNPNVQGIVWNYFDITRQKEIELELASR